MVTYELDNGNLFIKQIDYDLGPQPSNYPPKIVLYYSPASGARFRRSFNKGYRQYLNQKRLQTIKVYGSDEDGIQSCRYYSLECEWDEHEITKRLTRVTPGAKDTAPLPQTEFSYNDQPWDWDDLDTIDDPITDPSDPASAGEEQRSLRSVYGNLFSYSDMTRFRERTVSKLADVDGDGDQDMLYVRWGTQTWYWRENINNTWSTTESMIALPAECNAGIYDSHGCERRALERDYYERIDGTNTRFLLQAVRDFNNDGIPDIIYISKDPTGSIYEMRVCPGSISFSPQKTVSIGACSTYLTRSTPWGLEREIRSDYQHFVQALFVDVNGDGILDHVEATTDTSAELTLFGREPGQHVTETTSLPSCDAQYSNDSPMGCLEIRALHGGTNGGYCTDRLYQDINGDGLPDLLVADDLKFYDEYVCEPLNDHDVVLYPGNGHGLNLTASSYIDLTGSWLGASESGHQWSGFYDMNGDGLPDHVRWGQGTYVDKSWGSNTDHTLTVRLNTGGGLYTGASFDPPLVWTILPGLPSISGYIATGGLSASAFHSTGSTPGTTYVGWTYTRQALTDFDGDGFVDIVSVPQTSSPDPDHGGDTTPWSVIFNNHHLYPPDLLSKVEVRSDTDPGTHDGMTISVQYAQPEQSSSTVKYPLWAPTNIYQSDLVTNRGQYSNIFSHDPKHDPEQNMFLGFSRVDVVEPDRTTQHFYHQNSFAAGIEYHTVVMKDEAVYQNKTAAAYEAGAHHVIDKSRADLWAEAGRLTRRRGYDAVFDANGVSTLRRSYCCLRPTGRLVVYGFHSMLPREGGRPRWLRLTWDYLRTPRFNPLEMSQNNRSVMAFNLSYLFDRTDLLRAKMADLLRLLAKGQIRPLPVTTYPLDQVARAHQDLESGQTVGKLVLLP